MADWIFQGNPRRHDLDAAVTASREHWWGTPRYYAATIVSETYEHPRPFRGFQGSNVPVPPDVAAALAARAALLLEPLASG
jgi:hypothetical protein